MVALARVRRATASSSPRSKLRFSRKAPETASVNLAALSRLTDDQREAVVLKIYEGFKFEEMAEILECPVSTIKSRLYTALDLLKESLAPIQLRGVE